MHGISYPRVRLDDGSPAGLPLLRVGRVIGRKPFLPEGVPRSLSDHMSIISNAELLVKHRSASGFRFLPALKCGASAEGGR